MAVARHSDTPAVPAPARSSVAPSAEVVSAGNEVLGGDVPDTNTNRLCVLVTGLGGVVRRTVMVRDEPEAIASEIAGAIAREPALVFTVGGLGPTSDDRTLAGVALGLGLQLELQPEAERMVREKYAEFHAHGLVPFAEMNDARRKMAMLPAGARPIVNPIGGAPAVLTQVGTTTIVSLPGVPEELVAIVEQSLGDLFATIFGAAHYEERALVVAIQDESAIATILRAAELDHPDVYVKSRAKVLGSTRKIRVTLSARGPDHASVDGLIEPAAEQLLAQIAAAGYAVRDESEAGADA